ncbi:hypothetical protein WMY93_022715 [Mugilogobius chulae]|uniref:Uncharacterized protein n=1 Tax=Mugilogobius chulae TaxID=88201 RepID=A0AAW0N8W3_9GOBI
MAIEPGSPEERESPTRKGCQAEHNTYHEDNRTRQKGRNQQEGVRALRVGKRSLARNGGGQGAQTGGRVKGRGGKGGNRARWGMMTGDRKEAQLDGPQRKQGGEEGDAHARGQGGGPRTGRGRRGYKGAVARTAITTDEKWCECGSTSRGREWTRGRASGELSVREPADSHAHRGVGTGSYEGRGKRGPGAVKGHEGCLTPIR